MKFKKINKSKKTKGLKKGNKKPKVEKQEKVLPPPPKEVEEENSDSSEEEDANSVEDPNETVINQLSDAEQEDSEDEAPVEISSKKSAKEDDSENPEAPKKIAYDKDDEPKTVFCGNIPNGFNVNQTRVKDLFSQYGAVKSIRMRTEAGKKIFNKKSKQKLDNFNAYIVFENEEDAKKSLELNGKEILGHHLRVNMANKKSEAFSNKGTIFLGNLPFEALESEIYDFFKSVGKIEYVRKIPQRGIGYVRFEKGVNIANALKLNDEMFSGRKIRVQRCETQEKQEKKKLFKKDPKTGKIGKQKIKKSHKIKDNVLMSGRANNNPIIKKIKENQKAKFNKFSDDKQITKKEMFRKGGKMDQNLRSVNREKTKKKQTFTGSKVDDINMKSKKIKKNKVSKSIKEQKVIVKKLKSAAARDKKG